jgi:TolA-binding protein
VSTANGACPEDLLVQRRRRALSDLEERVVAAHLAGCEPCRTGETMAALLREGQQAMAGDGEMVARVAAQVSAALAAPPERSRRSGRRVAFAALALLCAGGGAFAWIGVGRGREPGPAAVASRGAPVSPPTTTQAPPRTWPAGSRAAPAAEEPRASGDEAGVPSPAAVPRPSKRRGPAPPDVDRDEAAGELPVAAPTAASLFIQANAIRRAGDLARAARLYRALRERFPGSDEAQFSSISLGDLLLLLQAPGEALKAFDSYLAEASSGSLREEALFGRARCLRRLGRDTDEEQTWRALLNDFPRSTYGHLARQRIEDLRR